MDKKKPAREKSKYAKAEASPGFLFWKTFNAWSRLLRVELDKLELTQVQYSIMAAVTYLGSTQEHVSQQDVANQLAMDKMMVSDVVKALETKKMILRKPHPQDGRSFSISLTESAKQQFRKAVPIVENTDENFFGTLSSKQRSAFLEALITLQDPNNQGAI
jgi:DNA-binding MarR family transcriptional regulator